MTTRVLVAPDKFKGSLTAGRVADAVAEGIRVERLDWAITELPVADGGDGTVAAAIAAGWFETTIDTTGPTGQPIRAAYATRGSSAVVELASAVGLDQLPDRALNPLGATTFGLGTMIGSALDRGAREVVIGLGGNDYAVFALAAAGCPRHVEIDTSYYVGNAPGWVSLHTIDARKSDIDDLAAWQEILPRTAVQPDTRHRLLLDGAPAATHLRLDVYPDGGLSRLRLFGELDAAAAADTHQRWWDALPASHRSLIPRHAPRWPNPERTNHE